MVGYRKTAVVVKSEQGKVPEVGEVQTEDMGHSHKGAVRIPVADMAVGHNPAGTYLAARKVAGRGMVDIAVNSPFEVAFAAFVAVAAAHRNLNLALTLGLLRNNPG